MQDTCVKFHGPSGVVANRNGEKESDIIVLTLIFLMINPSLHIGHVSIYANKHTNIFLCI
jgi:hypothetical protein